jgi:hypothetical protein
MLDIQVAARDIQSVLLGRPPLRVVVDEDSVAAVEGNQIQLKGRGLEVFLSPSQAKPGAANVYIFGQSEESVQGLIDDLYKLYPQHSFMLPIRGRGPHPWGTMGRVW